MQNAIKFFLFNLFLSIYQVTFSQNITAISPDKLNVLYIGIENPFTIAMEKVPADKLNVTISEGGIIKKTGSGTYVVTVTRSGKVTIFVEGNGSTAQKEFRVKPIPDPRLLLNVRSEVNGILKISEAKNAEYLIAPIMNFDIDAKCVIESFSMVIKHSNGASEIYENKGAKFSVAILKVFGSVKENDYIMFYNISSRCPSDPTARKLQGISFVIK
jgi:GldM C-terminal domain